MIPELGLLALILALTTALIQATLPLIGATRGMSNWISVARPAAYAQALFLLISYICLTTAFVSNDFRRPM